MATAVAEKPQATQPNDYAEQIAHMQSLLDMALEKRKFAQGNAVHEGDIAIAQFRDAIAILKEAETIPSALTQFGTHVSQEWSLSIPPAGIPEFRAHPGLRVKAFDYRVVTTDPVQIAFLRRAIERKSLDGLREMEPGLCCAISKDGEFYDWLEPEKYQRYVSTGSGRGW